MQQTGTGRYWIIESQKFYQRRSLGRSVRKKDATMDENTQRGKRFRGV